jgi:hypothetical protein
MCAPALAMTLTPPRVIPLKERAIVPPENQVSAKEKPTKAVLLLRTRRLGRLLPGRIVATPHGCPGLDSINHPIDPIVDPLQKGLKISRGALGLRKVRINCQGR